jgi:hypothetical protein
MSLEGAEYCNAILFRNIDYANINFWAVFSTFMSICSTSYISNVPVWKIWTMIKGIVERAQERPRKRVEKLTKVYRVIREYLRLLPKVITRKLIVIPTTLWSWRSARHNTRQGGGDPLHHLGNLFPLSTNVKGELLLLFT